MKSYPSIPRMSRDDIPGNYFYLFSKYDGSNIRAEWNSKKGFYKFGTRNHLMDETNVPFGQAISLLQQKYQEDLTKVFKELSYRDAICFFEYWGATSFAGSHDFQQPMDITLIDVNPFKQGILEPADFLQHFGHLDIAKVCYQGYFTPELFDQIKQSTLPGMSFEGVVAKAANDKHTKAPIMFKVKSQAWLDKLKTYCNGDDILFQKLC